MSTLSAEKLEQLQKLPRLQQKVAEELHTELNPPPGYATGEPIPVEW
jgi:hypothetical protein